MAFSIFMLAIKHQDCSRVGKLSLNFLREIVMEGFGTVSSQLNFWLAFV